MYYISCPRCDKVVILKFKIDSCFECKNTELVVEDLTSYEHDLDLEVESLEEPENHA